jgi:hypothetical protein
VKLLKSKTPTGDIIDSLYLQDKEIDDLNAELKAARQVRAKIEARLLKRLRSGRLDGARGKRAIAYVKELRHAKINNRPKLIAYIVRKRAFDLFTNAVSSKAYFDRLDDGETVPGVEIYTSTRINVQKAK